MITDQRINYLKQFYTPNAKLKFSEVLAIADKESSGVEYFLETDKLFKDNVAAASRITGLTKKEVMEEVLISKATYTSFWNKMFHIQATPAKYIKFRCEPSIYKQVKDLEGFTLKEKMLLASSVGIGQRLTYYWVLNSRKPKSQWIAAIKNFSTDLKAQIQEMCVNMSWWKLKANGNNVMAYSMYNAGGGIKQPTAYGLAVQKLTEYYAKYDK